RQQPVQAQVAAVGHAAGKLGVDAGLKGAFVVFDAHAQRVAQAPPVAGDGRTRVRHTTAARLVQNRGAAAGAAQDIFQGNHTMHPTPRRLALALALSAAIGAAQADSTPQALPFAQDWTDTG